ncbi:MAG: hypothetical protein ACT4OZ_07445 [Gemmatimonadota bacterium]
MMMITTMVTMARRARASNSGPSTPQEIDHSQRIDGALGGLFRRVLAPAVALG